MTEKTVQIYIKHFHNIHQSNFYVKFANSVIRNKIFKLSKHALFWSKCILGFLKKITKIKIGDGEGDVGWTSGVVLSKLYILQSPPVLIVRSRVWIQALNNDREKSSNIH